MKRIFTSIFVILTISVLTVSAQSFTTQRMFEKAVGLANEGKFDAALTDFEDVLALAKIDDAAAAYRAKIHFNIGVCLYRLKQNEKAVAEFEEAVKLARGDYEKAFYALGMAQAELKNWQKAEAAFRSALRLDKQNGEAWFDLAFVYLAQKDYEAARAAFEKSVRYKSVSMPVGHNNLGVIFALGGDLTAAVREFETALKKSNGRLAIAERNLQFCKSLGQNFNRDLLAVLEFGEK
ncbi:MAG TPA: tetratricopeptide repeat protein [Pyrinomonadaceae bacterium]|jgi:tetratricopeptide (TPR) repeat protein